MMTFAARYIGQPLSRYYLGYRVLCEANLAVQRDFSLDIVQAISDPYREAADFGLQVEFPEDGLQFALPYEQWIFAAVHGMGALTRLRICGDTIQHPVLDGSKRR
jgi:hypothetical protein